MVRLFLVIPCALLSGCAAVAPLGSLVGGSHGGPPPLQVHEETTVQLARDDFSLVKTNVTGMSKGFSLLGIITIVPPTLTKAMNRLYGSAQMETGRPETVAHLVIEQTTSFYILFGIPKIEVRADIVEFRPEAKISSRSGVPSPGS